MPEISRFYGIAVRMFCEAGRHHQPHFHAFYGEYLASFAIDPPAHFGPLRDHGLFGQVKLDRDFGALEWPNGADIDPTVLYDWPEHVEAIIAQRKSLLAEPV